MKKYAVCSLLSVLVICFNTYATFNEKRLGELLSLEHSDTIPTLSKREIGMSAAAHESTPAQPSGPFYPITLPDESDSDLTVVGRGLSAAGVAVYVQGRVMNTDGEPLARAVVEIWQACQSGKYRHPSDSNPAVADPYFQYYASTTINADGYFIFKTIVPGPYPASGNWMRPPHIHFLITLPGYKTLVTQMYFDGNSFPEVVATVGGKSVDGSVINQLNQLDFLLQKISAERQKSLITSFNLHPGAQIKTGTFDIYLQKQ